MSNVRKTWKTLSAVPDPFEAGVVYVTQEQTGYYPERSSAGGPPEDPWEPLKEEPVTRVQRCRLHANGRLENTDVAPKDIDSAHKVTINPAQFQDVQTLAKLVSRELDFRDKNKGEISADEWRKTNGFKTKDKTPDGLTVSEDGALLNWLGENYLRQSDVPESSWPALDSSGNKKSEEVALAPWLSDEVPVSIELALGVLRTWLTQSGTQIAILGSGSASAAWSSIAPLFGNPGLCKTLGVYRASVRPSTRQIEIGYLDKAQKPSTLHFYGTDNPGQMSGWQAHHFMVQSEVLEQDLPKDLTGGTALDNLQMMVRLGDNPDGLVLDKF